MKHKKLSKSGRYLASLRGQAALEFLMTYAWAIMVVLVGVASLTYFGVLSPDNFLPAKCVFQPGISCLDFKIENTAGGNGRITLRVQNSLGADIGNIVVTAGNCGSASSSMPIPNGDSQTITINCAGPLQGSKYNNQVNLTFSNLDTGVFHTYQGSLVDRIVGESSGSSFFTSQTICQNAETSLLCDGLDVVYGTGYKCLCCSEHNLCCTGCP